MVKNKEDGGIGLVKVKTLFGNQVEDASDLISVLEKDLDHSIYSFIKV